MKPVKGCSTSSHIFPEQLLLPFSAIVESVLANSGMTSNGKLPFSGNDTLPPNLSAATSEAESTSSEKGFGPYWNDSCAAINSRLWLPIKTDSADSDSTLWSTWLNKTVAKSWFSTTLRTARNPNSPLICLASSTSSLVECTDSGNTIVKSRKIRFYPNLKQKETLKWWFGVSRYVYNQTIEYLRKPGTKANWKEIKGEILKNLPEWAREVPYQVKSIAIRDACKAVTAAKKKFNQTSVFQEVKFRNRHNPVQSFYVPKSAVSEHGVYYTVLGQLSFAEELPENFGDCRLVRASGIHYLTVPNQSLPSASENQGRVVAIDPGVRSFLTFFSETSCGWIGQGDISRIQRLCVFLDKLTSRIAKAKSKQKRRLRKAASRLRSAIRHLVDEIHHKAARFLVDNFDVILLPTFETSQMTVKKARKIQSKTARQMLTWSHYRFKQFLKHKAQEYGKTVLDVCEAYTSKTVSWTGEIIGNLGGRKTIRSKDGRAMDRDLNGARGIFLRALGDTPFLRQAFNLFLDCIVNES